MTVAVPLLTGTVRFLACWIGPLAAFGVTAVPVVTACTALGLARRLAACRTVRRLLRSLPGA
ncbi:hypothetical protein [Streptomyces cadmiisoli]|uniref:hypothetical protein n=1 Tax=Streptomyces cadmiisoli TaxID=2184053 RepID=UPI0036536F54